MLNLKALQPAGGHILVADDNEDAAASLGMLLEMSGYTIDVVNDGARAIQVAQIKRPRLRCWISACRR
jgi:CheY-like chemotaxis protein